MEAAVIVSYNCNAKCHMCNTWQFPTDSSEELNPATLQKLPKLDFCNITGGEPFLKDNLEEYVYELKKKAKRIVISTNGFYTDRILSLVNKHKDLGIRVSIEGLPAANDELRGLKDGFDHGLRTLLELQRLGLKDIGFGITVSDRNCQDMIELYQLASALDLEFATAVVHNSYYFHKHDNAITKKAEAIACFKELINELLKTSKMKSWFRAYFNYGLINFIREQERFLPCEAGTENFFVTPTGDIVPCNGSENPWVFGNIREHSFDEIWNSEQAQKIRKQIMECKRNCWMIGTAAPVMKKYLPTPLKWVMINKLKSLLGKSICLD